MLDKNSESQVHVDKIEEPQSGTSIAFGLERMGLIAVKVLAPAFYSLDRSRAPLASCPMCSGDGEYDVFVADTRSMSA